MAKQKLSSGKMAKKARSSNQVLGIKVDSTRHNDLLNLLERRIQSGKKTFVITLNPEMAVLAGKQPDFKAIINRADVVIPDGVGIVWALRKQGIRAERITGTDLMLELIKKGYRTVLVGGAPGIAQKAAETIRRNLVGHSKPDIKTINRLKPDLLFVALGHGQQERWIAENLHKLNVKLAMGVGGAIDQIAKPRLRAPKFVQTLGLEWFYRLLIQPWRLKRQLALLEFILKVLK